jgi:hypothetical protein
MALRPERPSKVNGRSSGGRGVEWCGLGADKAAGCVAAAFEVD